MDKRGRARKHSQSPAVQPTPEDEPSGALLPLVSESEAAEGSFHDNRERDPGHEQNSAQRLDLHELKPILEALLLVAHQPLSLGRLAALIDVVPKAEIGRALRSLQEEYDQAGRGFQVVLVAGGYQLVTRPEYGPWVKQLDRNKSSLKLSRSALESLAIIAYKQPIVRSDVEAVRGVEVSGVLRTLLERKLVRIVGRKDMPGRPILYGTTQYFLRHFGLHTLSDLPPLCEFKELGEAEQIRGAGDGPLAVENLSG